MHTTVKRTDFQSYCFTHLKFIPELNNILAASLVVKNAYSSEKNGFLQLYSYKVWPTTEDSSGSHLGFRFFMWSLTENWITCLHLPWFKCFIHIKLYPELKNLLASILDSIHLQIKIISARERRDSHKQCLINISKFHRLLKNLLVAICHKTKIIFVFSTSFQLSPTNILKWSLQPR